MIFMKVLPGSGPVISSLLYQMNYSGIFGTIGDDSTVLIVCKTEESTADFRERIDNMLSN